MQGAQGTRSSPFWAISNPYPWDGMPYKAAVMSGDVANVPNYGPPTSRCA